MSFAPVKFKETAEFKKGDAGQREVARWFQEFWGAYVTPSYDYSGDNGDKAPKMQGFHTSHPIPDLDIGNDGDRYWVEVKTMQSPSFTRITGEPEHGISKRLWDHYLEVQRVTGTRVVICINEKCSGELLFATIHRLSTFDPRPRSKLTYPRLTVLHEREMYYFPKCIFDAYSLKTGKKLRDGVLPVAIRNLKNRSLSDGMK